MRLGVRTKSRVRTPLPTITASASHAKLNGAWDWTTTPFIDATRADGHPLRALSSGCLTRFSMAEAINGSSSLKPSNVRMAIRMRALRCLTSRFCCAWDDRRRSRARYPQRPAVEPVVLGENLESVTTKFSCLVVADVPAEVPTGDRVFRASVDASSLLTGSTSSPNQGKERRA